MRKRKKLTFCRFWKIMDFCRIFAMGKGFRRFSVKEVGSLVIFE